MNIKNRGFATLLVLMIFLVLAVIIIIAMKTQHYSLYTAQFFDNKSLSRSTAETVAKQIVKETYAKTTEKDLVLKTSKTITINGYKTESDGSLTTVPYGLSTPKTTGKDNCTGDGTVIKLGNINFIVPKQGFCMIEDDPKHIYTLILDGCNDENCTVKSRVSVGFSID